MIEVKVSQNGMLAEVLVKPEPEEALTVEAVKSALQVEGVQVGIDENIIRHILENKRFDVSVPVAKGKPPVSGKDAYYEYFFETDAKDGVPRVREDGSVDYSKVIVTVNAGDLLAKYHPETNGNFGYNVFAKALSPVRGKPARPLRCKNVRQEEDCYYAETNGRVSLEESAITVRNVLDIEGDADYNSGNVQFNGDIHVNGNITGGILVQAEGSVIVDGVIEGARVSAGRDVIVSRGIHGRGIRQEDGKSEEGFTVVEAQGDLRTKFIDHAFAKVGGNLITDYAVGSIVEAEGHVIAKGAKGVIVSGCVRGNRGVEADRVGNEAGLKTEIRVSMAKDTTFEGRVAPIIVHKMVFSNVKFVFGEMGMPAKEGLRGVEFRKINGRVFCKPAGSFTEAELSAGDVSKEAKTVAEEKPCVLLIDDDVNLLHTVYRILSDQYQVAATKSGDAARKYLETGSADIILLDYMMPGENGVEVLKSLRAWDRTKDIPVVFLTGLGDKKKIIECLSLHPAGYIMKPVEREKLLEKVGAVIGMKK